MAHFKKCIYLVIATGLIQILSNPLHAQKIKGLAIFGIDYRQYPTDIENVPPGPSNSNGLPLDAKFWRTMSINTGIGAAFKKNYSAYLNLFTRYNQLHWTQGVNYTNPIKGKRKDRKNIKFDMFLDLKKNWIISKKRDRSLFAGVGIGFTNLNTKYDFFQQDTLNSGPTTVQHFKGNFLHFGPKINLGIQIEKVSIGFEGIVIEGPHRNRLTSLWLGGTLSYELTILKKSNRSKK